VVAEIEASRGRASFLQCDVGDVGSVGAARDGAVDLFGGIDCLVNNAGFDRPDFFLQTDPSSWEPLIRVNLFGVLNCTHTLAPVIAERCRASGYGRHSHDRSHQLDGARPEDDGAHGCGDSS
jgi:2-hydroxycyclohexanecarboxyl-CoA dehydrogenase